MRLEAGARDDEPYAELESFNLMRTVLPSARFLFLVIPAKAGMQRSSGHCIGARGSRSFTLSWLTPKKFFVCIAFLLALIPLSSHAAEPADLDEQTRALSAELRCVVCQNLSVADSPSEMAQQMRAIVRERLEAHFGPDGRLTAGPRPPGGFRAEIELPLEAA